MPQYDKNVKRAAALKRLGTWRHRAYELLEHEPEHEPRIAERVNAIVRDGSAATWFRREATSWRTN